MNMRLSLLRIPLHGIFLVSTNLCSVIVAFTVVQVAPLDSEKIIQASIALLINSIIYVAVFKLMDGIQEEIMRIDSFRMLFSILLASLVLLPVIFYPMYYLTQGRWSSFDNLLATWPYQFIVNGLCLVTNYYLLRSKKNS